MATPPEPKIPAATSVKPHQRERKKMRKTISVVALLLALTCPAYAGEMQNDKPASPPQPASAVQESTDTMQEPVANGITGNDASDGLTQIALELLSTLSSLL
jgi:hypothetical protein